MDRRTLLAAGVVGLTGSLAGCLGVFGGDSSQESVTVEGVPVGQSSAGKVPVHTSGTAALVDFFATWCAPCKPQMSILRSIHGAFDEESLSMLSITQETDQDVVREFWREYDGSWTVAIDDELAASRQYDVTSVPTLIVLSADGTEQFRHVGLVSEERLREAVRGAIEQSED